MDERRQQRRLWYTRPAADWNTALPLGGGCLGMMVFGGTEREQLQLNEESLWSGYPAQWDEPACREHLPEIRRLLFAGRPQEAEALCRERIKAARAMGFDAVLAEQAAWMAEAMGRCTLSLPADPALEALATDARLERVRQGGRDLGLVRLYFDYGRYLFIGSAWGRLPANLQGVWCKDMTAPWNGDFHININLQMNYWFVDAAGLEEYGDALYRYIAFLAEHGARTARVMYGCRGWVAHVLANPWGFTAPGQDPLWGGFLCGGAWCCRHLYEHYLYTGDRDFLRRYWPVIRGSTQFFADLLVEDPATGWLVTAPSSSPENSYIDPVSGQKTSVCSGPTMDTAIIRELFEITLRCASVLDGADELTAALPGLLERLPPYQIGEAGNIQEWMEDYQEAEPGHRHISPLYGLYPGWQISPTKTPKLAAAARRTLERRLANGGGHTGWSRAWIINFYARLGDGRARSSGGARTPAHGRSGSSSPGRRSQTAARRENIERSWPPDSTARLRGTRWGRDKSR